MSRSTLHIKRRAASSLHHAPALAEAISRPLTRFITINFSDIGMHPNDAILAFRKIRDVKYGHWIRRPARNSGHEKSTPTFAWVLENAGDVFTAHWLVHIPPARLSDFTIRLPIWLSAVAGCPVELAASALDQRGAYNPRGARKYMLKGIDPVYAAFYGITPKAQGLVDGKRAGVSQNLGPTAKRAMREKGLYRRARRLFLSRTSTKNA